MRALETRRRVNENQIYPVQMITYLICITDKQNNNNNNKFHQLSVLQDCGNCMTCWTTICTGRHFKPFGVSTDTKSTLRSCPSFSGLWKKCFELVWLLNMNFCRNFPTKQVVTALWLLLFYLTKWCWGRRNTTFHFLLTKHVHFKPQKFKHKIPFLLSKLKASTVLLIFYYNGQLSALT